MFISSTYDTGRVVGVTVTDCRSFIAVHKVLTPTSNQSIGVEEPPRAGVIWMDPQQWRIFPDEVMKFGSPHGDKDSLKLIFMKSGVSAALCLLTQARRG